MLTLKTFDLFEKYADILNFRYFQQILSIESHDRKLNFRSIFQASLQLSVR